MTSFKNGIFPKSGQEVILSGTVERIFYRSTDGWTAFRLKHKGELGKDSVSCSGYFTELKEGEDIKIVGQWENNPKYGWQIKVNTYIPEVPTEKKGLKRYLSSSQVFGIGPVFAGKIVEHFKEDTIKILDECNPLLLMQVPGVGQKRAEEIIKGWKEGGIVRDTMIALAGYGIGELTAVKLMRHYGPKVLEVLRKDPFITAEEVDGIGFKKADAIAMGMKMPLDDPRRIKGAVRFVLLQALENGHCYLTDGQIEMGVEKLIEFWDEELIDQMAEDGRIVVENRDADGANRDIDDSATAEWRDCYLPHVLKAEQELTENIVRHFQHHKDNIRSSEKFDAINFDVVERLTPEQNSALKMVFNSNLSILTGGPGTGKTTTIQEIVKICAMNNIRLLLCAPTGRAAKRMNEVTGHEASTIHRLLEYIPETRGFARNEESPLNGDMIIIDESSMVDIFLLNSLLKAVPAAMKMALIGDRNQLPSVGPGNVLRDLLEVSETWNKQNANQE